MASEKKVALITGGASGMGYAVAEALSSQGDWDIHLLDMTTERGNAAAERLNATFHTVDVNNYESLGGVFKTVFKKTKRLDFVHANAGIVEKGNFYAVHDTGDEPPPPLPSVVIDIDLMSVIHTSYLAQHYFRQSPKDDIGPRSLIVTASCGGLYAIPQSPAYTAAKFGCVGFVRSIAGRMWREDGIRVNVSRISSLSSMMIANLTPLWKGYLPRNRANQSPPRGGLEDISKRILHPYRERCKGCLNAP